MNANELMLGDWVKYHGVPVRVVEISEKSVEFEYKYGSYDIDYPLKLTPIPITPEILEKNGFIYKDAAHNNFRGVWVCNVGRCNNVFIQFTDKVAIEIHNELGRKDEKGRADLVSFCRDWCEVLFVHELQHALRLCGIEKEIVL